MFGLGEVKINDVPPPSRLCEEENEPRKGIGREAGRGGKSIPRESGPQLAR